MQTKLRINNLARKLGGPDALLHRAQKTGRIFVVKQRFDEYPIYNHTTRKLCKGSNTSSFPPFSVSERGAMTVREAGRRGGLSCLRNRGRGFFGEIGWKGQRVMRARHPNMARQWGKLGGRPKKPALRELMGQESK